MDFIKKHLFLLLCGAVAALGAGVFGLGMWAGMGNAKKVQKVQSEYDRLASLQKNLVSDRALAQVKEQAAQAEQVQKQVFELARQSSRRPLLSKEVFPRLRNDQDKDIHYGAFAANYCRFVDDQLLKMKAKMPPTAAERRQSVEQLLYGAGGSSGVGGEVSGVAPTGREEQAKRLIDDLNRQRAMQTAIYAGPEVFCAYDHWKSRPTEVVKVLAVEGWYTQLAAWIQEDVVDSIIEINGSSGSVLDSPVKRLLEISFAGRTPVSRATAPTGATAGGAAYGEPSAVLSGASGTYGTALGPAVGRRVVGSELRLPTYVRDVTPSATALAGPDSSSAALPAAAESALMAPGMPAPPPVFAGILTEPYTRHVGNDVVDVVQFEVGVVIDAARLNDLLRVLQSEKATLDAGTGQAGNVRNQITVLSLDVQPLSIDAERTNGFYYGNCAVQVARLLCEYVFFKAGYKDLVPPAVLEAPAVDTGMPLAYPTTTPAAPPSGYPGGSGS